MKAKFIEITSFDMDVEEVSVRVPIWHLDKSIIADPRLAYPQYSTNDVQVIEKVYNRIKLVDNEDIYSPYIYYINYEDINHAIPIIMHQLHEQASLHRQDMLLKDGIITDLRSQLYSKSLKDRIKNTIKIWFGKHLRLKQED